VLTEHVRRSLGNVIARLYMDSTGAVRGVTMGARIEQALGGLFGPRAAAHGNGLLSPDTLAAMLRELHTISQAHATEGRPLPLIVPPNLRVGVRRLIEPVMPQLPVVSLAELPPTITLSRVATWEMPNGI
jgi:flagellar biosynthesis protein FlhA